MILAPKQQIGPEEEKGQDGRRDRVSERPDPALPRRRRKRVLVRVVCLALASALLIGATTIAAPWASGQIESLLGSEQIATTRRPERRQAATEIETLVPKEVSTEALRSFADSTGHVVYWAGILPGRRFELTKNDRGDIFVRYLPEEAPIGDGRPAYTTVATYPLDAAYRLTVQAADRADMSSKQAPGGGLAVWRGKRPTSIYLAYPGSDYLIEVYDPSWERAQDLALSGDVGPIR
jgi:hypothetical protein